MRKNHFLILIIVCIGMVKVNAQAITATIEKIYTERDVFQNSQKGMKIHVRFSVVNMLNKTGQCNAYFYSKNKDMLIDSNQKYNTKDGKVASCYDYTPTYSNCIYEDFVIFMPYEELHVEGSHDLKFRVAILDDKFNTLDKSSYYDFFVYCKPSTSTQLIYIDTAKQNNYRKNNINKWGLGTIESEYVSPDRNYDWYIDQTHTGYASNNNCGPACAVMAAKWSDSSFNKSVENARDTYPNDGHWWYVLNIYDFLINNKIPCSRYQDNLSQTTIKKHIDNGSIIIVLINTKDITYNKNAEERTGKHYDFEENHFVIIKGYCVVDDKTHFEVYDPVGGYMYHLDGARTQKGKNRYYSSSEVIFSVLNLNSNYIVVSSKKIDELPD